MNAIKPISVPKIKKLRTDELNNKQRSYLENLLLLSKKPIKYANSWRLVGEVVSHHIDHKSLQTNVRDTMQYLRLNHSIRAKMNRIKKAKGKGVKIDFAQIKANLDITSPAYLLRKKLIKDKMSLKKMDANTKIALIIKAWNFTRSGESTKILKFNGKKDHFPEIK